MLMGISWKRKRFKRTAHLNPPGGRTSHRTRPACLRIELNTSSICALMASPIGGSRKGAKEIHESNDFCRRAGHKI